MLSFYFKHFQLNCSLLIYIFYLVVSTEIPRENDIIHSKQIRLKQFFTIDFVIFD